MLPKEHPQADTRALTIYKSPHEATFYSHSQRVA
jgi:hypothetical protein